MKTIYTYLIADDSNVYAEGIYARICTTVSQGSEKQLVINL